MLASLPLFQKRLSRFVSGIPVPLLLVSTVLPIAGFVSGYWLGPVTGPENTRFFLSGLAGAQAAILAIVFSVTVIGVQLIGTRYSPRMVIQFTRSPIFRYTFWVFVLSIAVNLALLYTVPEPTMRVHTAGVFAAGGLGVATISSLLVFVQSAIRQSTPDGAIDAFASILTTDRYIAEVHESVESESENAHPMRPLYTLTMNAISQGERVTAEKALHTYRELAEEVLSELQDRDAFEEEERDVVREFYEPVLEEHLRDIALHGDEQDEHRIVKNATEVQHDLGASGLDIDNNIVSWQAASGLSNVVSKAPVDTGSFIANNNAWEQQGELLEDAATYPRPSIVYAISSSIKNDIQNQLWKVNDIGWYGNSMRNLYGSMENAHTALIEEYGEEIEEVDMEWQYDHVPDDVPTYGGVSAIYRFRMALLNSTEYFLRYAIEEGEYPITMGNCRSNWKNICVTASTSPAEDYAITLCQALIEIAFIDYRGIGEQGTSWTGVIARVKQEGDPEIVERAFERILSHNEAEKPPQIGRARLNSDEEYYSNMITADEFQPLNSNSRFRHVVEEIQTESNERWERIRGE